MSGLVGK